MSLEYSPARLEGADVSDDRDDLDYWHRLINEMAAADFVGLTYRTMQGYRQKGGGPRFVHVSSRCVRYRRIDLKQWADARLRSSTSDPGLEAMSA